MTNVIRFNGITSLDSMAEAILEQASEADLAGCVIIGYRQDGTEYFASSYADGGEVLWLLRRAEHKLMGIVE